MILWRRLLLWNRYHEVKPNSSGMRFAFALPVQWKQILGDQSWNAIYKLLLKGSEHPQRINVDSENGYSSEPGQEVSGDESRNWTWKNTKCWRVVCVREGDMQMKSECGKTKHFLSKSDGGFEKLGQHLAESKLLGSQWMWNFLPTTHKAKDSAVSAECQLIAHLEDRAWSGRLDR